MSVTIRITSANGASQTFTMKDGQALPAIAVAPGDRIEIVDGDGRGVTLALDGDDAVLAWSDGAEAARFQSLVPALAEGEVEIRVVDGDSETVIASIEDLLAGFSTAAGGASAGIGPASGFGSDGSIDEQGLEGGGGDPLGLGPPLPFGIGSQDLVTPPPLQDEESPDPVAGTVAEDANQRPMIGALKGHRSVTETDDCGCGENAERLTTGGTIAFTDRDLGDTHTVTVLPEGSGYLGTLAATLVDEATGDGTGSIAWSFSVDDAAVDHLAAGETLTQRYVVRVSDGEGGIANKLVEITIVGSNDGPVIGALAGARTVHELEDGAPGEGAAALTTGGAIAFSDADLADVHAVTVLPQGTGYFGNLTAIISDQATGDGSGSIAWAFSVGDGDVDHLAAGETLIQRYVVRVEDNHGGIASKTVEIAIVGAEDGAPQLASLTLGGSAGGIYGGAGDDILAGGPGADVLFGGRGDDVLSGGAGDDVFVIGRDDLGDGVRSFTDTVTDFAAGDTLDLSDVVDFFADDVGALLLLDSAEGVVVQVGDTGQTVVVIENQAASGLTLDQDGNITANG